MLLNKHIKETEYCERSKVWYESKGFWNPDLTWYDSWDIDKTRFTFLFKRFPIEVWLFSKSTDLECWFRLVRITRFVKIANNSVLTVASFLQIKKILSKSWDLLLVLCLSISIEKMVLDTFMLVVLIYNWNWLFELECNYKISDDLRPRSSLKI